MKTRSGLLLLLCTSGLIGGPAYGGPPFRTDDPEPVEYQHWEVYQFSAATHSNCSAKPEPARVPGVGASSTSNRPAVLPGGLFGYKRPNGLI